MSLWAWFHNWTKHHSTSSTTFWHIYPGEYTCVYSYIIAKKKQYNGYSRLSACSSYARSFSTSTCTICSVLSGYPTQSILSIPTLNIEMHPSNMSTPDAPWDAPQTQMLQQPHSIFHPSFGDLFIDFFRIFWFFLWAVSSVTNFVP